MPTTIIGMGVVKQDDDTYAVCNLLFDGFGRIICEPVDDDRYTSDYLCAEALSEYLSEYGG